MVLSIVRNPLSVKALSWIVVLAACAFSTLVLSLLVQHFGLEAKGWFSVAGAQFIILVTFALFFSPCDDLSRDGQVIIEYGDYGEEYKMPITGWISRKFLCYFALTLGISILLFIDSNSACITPFTT